MSRPEKHDRLILNKADWVCYLLNYLKRCRLILNIADWVCNIIRKEFISVNSTEKNSKEYYNTCGQREEEQRWWQMKPIKFWNIETQWLDRITTSWILKSRVFGKSKKNEADLPIEPGKFLGIRFPRCLYQQWNEAENWRIIRKFIKGTFRYHHPTTPILPLHAILIPISSWPKQATLFSPSQQKMRHLLFGEVELQTFWMSGIAEDGTKIHLVEN